LRKVLTSGIIAVFILMTNVLAQSKGGHWKFDNDSIDSATWDLIEDTGTIYKPAYFSDIDPVPDYGYYLSLESLDAFDFFLVDDSDDLDFDNENIGISAWIYPDSLYDVHYLINKGLQDTNPKTTNYALRISRTKVLEFLIRDANNKAQTVSSDITISEGKWTFVAAYYNYSEKKVYFWNEMVEQAFTSVDFNQDFFSNGDPLGIGAWAKTDSLISSNSNFEGRMDDVRISGRVEDIIPALSPVHHFNAVALNNTDQSLEIYPNPVSISGTGGQIQFRLKSTSPHVYNYTIYNILGQVVYRGTSMNKSKNLNIQWNIHNNTGYRIHTGIYFIEFKSRHTRLISKFLVIN
jgi:hypothetical protein